MFCDLETGICGPADQQESAEQASKLTQLRPPAKNVDLYYFTDPICSHCWAVEPVLRRFEHEYGDHLNVRVIMGGLLPSWDGFADRANGIRGPQDVAHHWREVGEASRMPIDGSLWLRDPVASSYPPSRVYAVIKERDAALAREFLRRAREAVFAFDRNISNPEVLAEIVDGLGHPELSGSAVVAEADSEKGQELLDRDLSLARELGVRGFPTILLMDEDGMGTKVTGVRPLETYVDALAQVLGEGVSPRKRELLPLDELLEREGRLFAKEIETYYGVAPAVVAEYVEERVGAEELRAGTVLGETYWERTSVGRGVATAAD
jgi:predicted DsbA family dithiol-disulfide isomerase